MRFSRFVSFLLDENFCNRLKKHIDMEIGDLLSKEELSAIKGGEWHYDEETDEWYWIEDGRKVLCPQENPRQS